MSASVALAVSPLVDLQRLFVPESVAPEGIRERPALGERRLLFALIENAIAAALDTRSNAKIARERLRARRWILEDGANIGGLTFDLCCVVNDIDPDWLRGGLCNNKLWQSVASAERVRLSRQHGLTRHRVKPKVKLERRDRE